MDPSFEHKALAAAYNMTNDPFVTYEELMKNGGPKRGDILEISRYNSKGFYQHFVIYDADQICYHVAVTADGSDAKPTKTTADILCQRLEDILKDSGTSTPSKVRVNNLEKRVKELKLKSRENKEIFEELEWKVKEEIPYGISKLNCEYYVTLWKYGKGFSLQSDLWLDPW